MEDVGRLVGDEKDIEIFQRLVDISNVGGLHRRVLGIGWNEFREGREEGLYPCPGHVAELTRDDSYRLP